MLGVDLAEMTGRANSGCLLCPVDYPCIGRCRHVWWVILADARSQQRLFSIDGCRRSRWVIPAVFCARWVILASVGVAVLDGSSLLSVVLGGLSLHREVSPCMVGYPCRCQKSTVAVFHWWVSLFSMDHPCCLLRSVGHPCIGGCRRSGGHSPSRCVAMLGVDLAEMTGANSGCLPCPVGHPCIGGCRCSCRVIPAVCCALWVIPALMGVAMLGGLSLLSAVLDGLSLQKSTAAVFH